MNTTTQALSFDLTNLHGGDKTPLLCQYAGQVQPQPAYIQLSEAGQVSADYSGEISGTPMRVAHMRDLTFSVSPYAKPAALAQLLEHGAGRPLLERIYAGHSVEWDGSNYRGHLSEDAKDAEFDLEQLLEAEFSEPDNCAQVWKVGDWLFTACTLADHWAEQSLDEAVTTIESLAVAEGIVLQGDVREVLIEEARRHLDHGHAGLGAQHFAALIAEGNRTQSDIKEYQADQA